MVRLRQESTDIPVFEAKSKDSRESGFFFIYSIL